MTEPDGTVRKRLDYDRAVGEMSASGIAGAVSAQRCDLGDVVCIDQSKLVGQIEFAVRRVRVTSSGKSPNISTVAMSETQDYAAIVATITAKNANLWCS